jgi:DNA gyrase/topoisomerase IV subunit A
MRMTNIEAENNRFKKELLALKKQNKKLSQKLEKTKNKTEGLKKELKKKRRADNQIERRTRTVTFEPVKRHEYSELIVRLSTLLYTRINCGFRQVVKILEVINETFDGLLGKIPSRNTIENWVKKCGLKVYEGAGESLQDTNYAEVVDESMMIGSEKLLLTIGVPAKHQGRPLNCTDVNMLDIAIANSWNGEKIGEHLVKAGEKVGHDPLYVISDNASIMNKGVRCAEMSHQHDISHSLGMYLERTYKNENDFKNYIKLMSESKVKHNMKEIAYLLPPTQRTISRFINLSGWVKWSSKMLDIYHTLKADEKKTFSFIPANASLIDELSDVVKCVGRIEYVCKHKGLSKKTVYECQNIIRTHLLCGNSRTVKLGECLIDFFRKEIKLIGTKVTAHNNSSDIIESLFGKYKARKSPNKLYGITSHVLFMPIYTALRDKKQARSFNFKAALE